ncbi:DMT family transporter [Bacterioplanoides pacificum]|uniref:DMT family transporter n=1 Tax=Bacterioplanoides pacificum TaxID=1171596 RepID=A0ABV7VXZ6_9GAMM
MANNNKAVTLALMAVLLWSTVATAFKLALADLTPLWLLAIASLTSLLFLTGHLLWQQRLTQAWQALQRQRFFYLRQGLINPLFYYLVLFQAYDLLPAQQAQSINYTWALTMSLLAVPMLGQRLFGRDILALFMAYIGVVVIATQGRLLALEFASISGVLLALFSTLLWSLYWIWNTAAKDEPEISLWSGFLIATPVIWLLAGWQGVPSSLAVSAGLAAVYVGLFEMGVTFLLWQKAMQATDRAASIGSLIFLSPFLSLIFISQILGEDIHPATFVGLVLIIAGLAVQKLKKPA